LPPGWVFKKIIYQNMMQRFESLKRENIAFSNYLVVVEFLGRGYIMALKASAEEAESMAIGITQHINSNFEDDAEFKDIIKPYIILIEYDIKGGTSLITNSVWSNLQGLYEIYVVGVSYKDGGLLRFIRERENYSVLLSVEDLIRKYDKMKIVFRDFTYSAN